jgi:hypothetical protein
MISPGILANRAKELSGRPGGGGSRGVRRRLAPGEIAQCRPDLFAPGDEAEELVWKKRVIGVRNILGKPGEETLGPAPGPPGVYRLGLQKRGRKREMGSRLLPRFPGSPPALGSPSASPFLPARLPLIRELLPKLHRPSQAPGKPDIWGRYCPILDRPLARKPSVCYKNNGWWA